MSADPTAGSPQNAVPDRLCADIALISLAQKNLLGLLEAYRCSTIAVVCSYVRKRCGQGCWIQDTYCFSICCVQQHCLPKSLRHAAPQQRSHPFLRCQQLPWQQQWDHRHKLHAGIDLQSIADQFPFGRRACVTEPCSGPIFLSVATLQFFQFCPPCQRSRSIACSGRQLPDVRSGAAAHRLR